MGDLGEGSEERPLLKETRETRAALGRFFRGLRPGGWGPPNSRELKGLRETLSTTIRKYPSPYSSIGA